MGWVENRFLDHIAYGKNIPKLWDKVRDNIGEAVVEFNSRVSGPDHLDNIDCRAKGQHCIRLLKTVDQSSIELFLDGRSLKTSAGDSTAETIICEFQLTDNRKEVEFFVREAETIRAISIDEACEMAVGEYIFNPFPREVRIKPDEVIRHGPRGL